MGSCSLLKLEFRFLAWLSNSPAPRGQLVTAYRCHLKSDQGTEILRFFECPDDSAVVVKAIALLDSEPAHRSIEIWDGRRFVASIPRTGKVHEDPHSKDRT